MTLTVPAAIFTESFLSYLGLGVRLPMLVGGQWRQKATNAISIRLGRLFFPALFISLTIFAFNAVGDGFTGRA